MKEANPYVEALAKLDATVNETAAREIKRCHEYTQPTPPPASPTVSLEVPAGQSAETAAMGVLEQVMERMLPTGRYADDPANSKALQENYYARERVAKWLADKYVGRG